MKRISTFLLLSLFAFSSVNAQDYAASIKVSTLGINLEAIRSFGPDINARLGVAFFSYSMDGGGGAKDDYKYSGDLKLTSISALADWFPFQNFFRVTGGVLINLNKADITMTPSKTYTVGNDQYTPEKLGNMDAKIDFNKFTPYIGLGIGNPAAGESGLGFTLDLGTAYQGNPKVDLAADGLLSPSAAPDQEQKLEENLSWFKWYPVLSLGLTYKF